MLKATAQTLFFNVNDEANIVINLILILDIFKKLSQKGLSVLNIKVELDVDEKFSISVISP